MDKDPVPDMNSVDPSAPPDNLTAPISKDLPRIEDQTFDDPVHEGRFVKTLPLREVRFAVAMVGGTSLAIYECGSAREFHRMVLGQGAYGLAKCITNSHAFIDVFAGTSAGGINAITLSCALANSTDLACASDIWIKGAGIDDLLQRPEDDVASTMLRGDEYYLPQIQECFGKLLDPANSVAGKMPYPSGFGPNGQYSFEMDVYITGTSYGGRDRSYPDITGQPVFTKDFNGVFHLNHSPRKSESHFRADLDDPDADQDWKNAEHAGRKSQERVRNRLARIARTTSCLPAVFEPSGLTIDELGKVIELPELDLASLPAELKLTPSTAPHWFFDGGFLDNRPVDLAVEAMIQRTATAEASRKFAFVEPVAVERTKSHNNFWDRPDAAKAISFFLRVPSNQSISRSLESVHQYNEALIRRRKQLTDIRRARLAAGLMKSVSAAEFELWNVTRREDLLDDLMKAVKTGAEYVPEDACVSPAILSSVDNDLNSVINRMIQRAAPHYVDIRSFIRWIKLVRIEVRDAQFPRTEALRPDPAARQHVAKRLRPGKSGRSRNEDEIKNNLAALTKISDVLQRELTDLLTITRIVGARLRVPAPIWDVEPVARQCEHVNKIVAAEITHFTEIVNRLSALLMPILNAREPWENFAWAKSPANGPISSDIALDMVRALDVFLYPYTRLVPQQGESAIDLVYISARSRQGGLSCVPAANKLAGDALFNLGGFLKRSWRINDIMWGRLDTVDALMNVLLEPERLQRMITADPQSFRSNTARAVQNHVLGTGGYHTGEKPALSEQLGALAHNRLLAMGALPGGWDQWKTKVERCSSGRELAELITLPLTVRHQIEIVNEMVPEAFAADLAEWAEQAAQNYTPDDLPETNYDDESELHHSLARLYPLPTPGSGAVYDQLNTAASRMVGRRLPDDAPARAFVTDGGYTIGQESEWRDIPSLITIQRAAQAFLIALQIARELVSPKMDALLFKLPRGIAWVVYGFFMALRQGKVGRVTALTVSTVVMFAVPLLLALNLMTSGAQMRMIGLWVIAFCFGGAVAHLRRGAGASATWMSFGVAVLLGSLTYRAATPGTNHPADMLAASALVVATGSVLFFTSLIRWYDLSSSVKQPVNSVRNARILSVLAIPIYMASVALGARYSYLEVAPRWWHNIPEKTSPFALTALLLSVGAAYLSVQQYGILRRGKVPLLEMVRLELANAIEACDMLNKMGMDQSNAKLTAIHSALEVDQWYLVLYTLALSLMSVQSGLWIHWLLTQFAHMHSPWVNYGSFAVAAISASFSVYAGLFDFTENVCLFGELEASRRVLQPDGVTIVTQVTVPELGKLPRLCSRVSRAKFACIAAATLMSAAVSATVVVAYVMDSAGSELAARHPSEWIAWTAGVSCVICSAVLIGLMTIPIQLAALRRNSR